MRRFLVALTVALTWGLGTTSALMSLLGREAPSGLNSAVLYVAMDGSDASDCDSVANRCRTLQRAVDVAGAGDLIKVAAGTYSQLQGRAPALYYHNASIITQVAYISTSVDIRGGYDTGNGFADPPASVSVLAPQGLGRGIYVAPGISVTLENLQFTGGNAAGMEGGAAPSYHDAGGGLYADRADTHINNCTFIDNQTTSGAGIYVNSGILILESSVISANVAITGYAGGLVVHSPSMATIRHNLITSNTAALNGGGLYMAYGISTSVVSNNLFSLNKAGSQGGGIYMNSAATFSHNVIKDNQAGFGGGIYSNSRSPSLVANRIVGNSAGQNGGGIMLSNSEAVLKNNVVAQNQVGVSKTGSGIQIQGGSPRLVHTTISQNLGGDGSGLFVTDRIGHVAALYMTNTILVSHTTGLQVESGSSATVVGILWYGNAINTAGGGTVTVTQAVIGSPAFINASGADYHIGSSSAARDNGLASIAVDDLDGEPRVGAPDLGADEYVLSVYLPAVIR